MEQIQNDLRANGAAKMALGKRRAVEKFAKHPQLSIDTEIKPTEEQVMSGGSIDARMKRVIGAGKKGQGKLVITHGGSDGMMKGGAYGEGRALRKHLEKLHGGEWFSEFVGGMMKKEESESEVEMEEKKMKGRGRPRKMAGGAGGGTTSAPPAGFEVEHAMADSQVAPNTRPAIAYGNPPQASPAFKKNTVGMGMKGCGIARDVECMAAGAGMAGAGAPAGAGKKKRAPSARNMLISKLMKGKGMSLAEASKYLKEHPQG